MDFRNLNQLSLKDNYPLPNMEHLSQRVTRSGMLSMLDGFSGSNQILVTDEDRHKTTFTTQWGTFEYNRMPFSLLNAKSTFQRAVDFSFGDIISKINEIYQDDLTMFSKDRRTQVKHLKQVFKRCSKYKISLNPKKSVFKVDEGELLGHIVTNDRNRDDPKG
jgi:hypothetical protein